MGESPRTEPSEAGEPAQDGAGPSPSQGAPAQPSSSSQEGGSRFAVVIATAGGVGFAPGAPGTFGSVVGVLLFFPLSFLDLWLFSLTLAALCALGIWASGQAERHFGRSDDGRIVIDEVAGVLLNLAPLVPLRGLPLPSLGLWSDGSWGRMAENEAFLALVVTGFVLFRVLDIRKPGPVRWAERRFGGGLGVMADDIVAGVLGAVLLTVPAYLLLIAGLRA